MLYLPHIEEKAGRRGIEPHSESSGFGDRLLSQQHPPCICCTGFGDTHISAITAASYLGYHPFGY